MKLRLDRTRMAMAGNVCCYDVMVPVSEVDTTNIHYFIISNGERYVLLEDATRPTELDAMPRGFARYDAFQVHYRATKLWAWSILQAHFPEIAGRPLKTLVEVPERLDHKTLTVEV